MVTRSRDMPADGFGAGPFAAPRVWSAIGDGCSDLIIVVRVLTGPLSLRLRPVVYASSPPPCVSIAVLRLVFPSELPLTCHFCFCSVSDTTQRCSGSGTTSTGRVDPMFHLIGSTQTHNVPECFFAVLILLILGLLGR